MHYAALDAQCLPQIAEKLAEMAAKEEHAAEITIEKRTKPLIFGEKNESPKDSSSKENKKDRKKRKRGPRRKKDDPVSSSVTDSESSMAATAEQSYDNTYEEEEKGE